MAKRRSFNERIRDPIPLQNHWENFVSWIMDKGELFALKYRYTLSARLINLALDIQEKIIRARFTSDKLALLQELHVDLQVLEALLRCCHTKRLLAHNAYEYACKQMEQSYKMVAGWKKYIKEKQ